MARSVTEAVDKLETGAARDDVHDDIHIEAGEAGGAGTGSAATASGEVVRASPGPLRPSAEGAVLKTPASRTPATRRCGPAAATPT